MEQELFNYLHKSGYIYYPNLKKWKHGKKQFTTANLSTEILPYFEKFDNTTEGWAQLIAQLEKVENSYSELKSKVKQEKSKYSKSFHTAYIDYITSQNMCTKVDYAIWGNIYSAKRENGDIYYVTPTGNANEYEEVSDDLADIGKNFTDGYVYTKEGRVKRGYIFSKIYNKLIKDFPIDNPNMAKPEDLNHKCLSPITLKHFIKRIPVKDDSGDIIGYKLEADLRTTIQDYFRVSSGTMGGNIKDLGTIEPLANDKKTPCLKYFDLDNFIKKGNYPAWKEFISQFRAPSGAKVYMAYVYSIFKATNKSPQLLWLHDSGNSGKSATLSVIKHFLGNSVGSVSDKNLTSDFGLETVIGKRLVVNSDCKKTSIIHSELIHSLTTGDPVSVNRKFKSQFTSQVYAKVVINSNAAPNIHTNEKNQLRRLIYLKLEQPSQEEMIRQGRIKLDEEGNPIDTTNPQDFYEKLKAEFPAFLYACKQTYEELCPNDNVIHLPSDVAEDVNHLNDLKMQMLEEFFNEHYDIVKYSQLTDDISSENIVSLSKLKDDLSDYLERDITEKDEYNLKSLLNNMYHIDRFSYQLAGRTFRKKRVIAGVHDREICVLVDKKKRGL